MTSLYGKYIKERECQSILENEHGFVTFAIYDTNIGRRLFIHDIFVVSEKRKAGVAKDLCLEVEKIAINEGCNHIMSGVDPTTLTATEALVFQIKMGAKVIGVSNGMINLFYEVKKND